MDPDQHACPAQSSSPFLLLPRELRDKIYRSILSDPTHNLVPLSRKREKELQRARAVCERRCGHTACTGRDAGYCRYATPADKRSSLETLNSIVDIRILCVNRQIFEEAQLILYKDNNFVVRTRVNNWGDQIELWTREKANVLTLLSNPKFDLCPIATLTRGYYKDGVRLGSGGPGIVLDLCEQQWKPFQNYLQDLDRLKQSPTSSCRRKWNMGKDEGVIGYRDALDGSHLAGR